MALPSHGLNQAAPRPKPTWGEIFDPSLAFSRNLGWLTPEDQAKLADLRVGIVGLGGVGGQYAEILARLGVRHFVLYDGDTFSVENTNRQNECRVSNYGRSKVDVVRDLILDINPTASVKAHARPLTPDEITDFCGEIDIYLDGLDYFVLELRIPLFRELRAQKKVAITVAPIGMGSACVVFDAQSMSFDDYFGLHTTTDPLRRSHLFLAGLSPTFQQMRYLADRSYADFEGRHLPSLPMGTYAAATAAATTLLKVVTGRGKLRRAPWVVHYDAFHMAVRHTYTWLGFRSPLARLRVLALKIFSALR